MPRTVLAILVTFLFIPYVPAEEAPLFVAVFASGPGAGKPVTAEAPAHVGDIVSLYYTNCGPVSEIIPPGQPAPSDRLVYTTVPPKLVVGDVEAAVLFSGLAPGWVGLCQLNFVVPVPQRGTTSPETTVIGSSLQLGIGQQIAYSSILPILFEPNSSALGNPAALVVVAEYGEYQCPYCASFFRDVWPQLKTEYVDTGKIKFTYNAMAFLGADSFTAAQAALCAGDQYRFWQYHDYLFQQQGRENGGWASASNQKSFAAQLGMNVPQFNECLDSGKYAAQVQTDNTAASSKGVTGTPTFFINGVQYTGTQPIAVFEAAINAALKR